MTATLFTRRHARAVNEALGRLFHMFGRVGDGHSDCVVNEPELFEVRVDKRVGAGI